MDNHMETTIARKKEELLVMVNMLRRVEQTHRDVPEFLLQIFLSVKNHIWREQDNEVRDINTFLLHSSIVKAVARLFLATAEGWTEIEPYPGLMRHAELMADELMYKRSGDMSAVRRMAESACRLFQLCVLTSPTDEMAQLVENIVIEDDTEPFPRFLRNPNDLNFYEEAATN